jgi:hypothetical protein
MAKGSADVDFLGLGGGSSAVTADSDDTALVFDLADVKEDSGFEIIPKGNYQAIVDELELTESSTSGAPMFAAKFKITEGEFEGRVVFDYWVLGGKGAEFGLGKLKKFLTRVCPEIPLGNFNAQAFSDEGVAIGRELVVSLKIQTQKKGDYKGEKRNQVADILAPSMNSFL